MMNEQRPGHEVGRQNCSIAELDGEAKPAPYPAISRRKLLASMDLSGAALFSGGMLFAHGNKGSVAQSVYGGSGMFPHDADEIAYQLAATTPERSVGDKLRETVSVKDFGATGDGSTDDTAAIRSAVDFVNATGGTVYFPSGTYIVNNKPNIQVLSHVHLLGSGAGASVIRSNGNLTGPIFNSAGSRICFDRLALEAPNTVNAVALINMNGGENITVHRCTLDGGHTAIWLNPRDGEMLSEIRITDNTMEHFNFGVYIGSHHTQLVGGTIKHVIIDRNVIAKGQQIGSGGDGIKTVRTCHNLVITNNYISDQSRDAIDLFASGDTVVVSGNILVNSLVKGLDIKSDLQNYPESKYGFNGRRLTITGNIIDNSGLAGVSISQNAANGDYNYLIDVSHNQISRSQHEAITCSGRFITLSHNCIFENCLASASYNAVLIGKNLPLVLTRDITIQSNMIVNNGSDQGQGHALYISAYVEDCLIQGNTIKNDQTLPNPKQKRGLYVNQLTKNIHVKDNRIADQLTINVTVVTNADLLGESSGASIGSLAAGTGGEYVLLSMPRPGAVIRAAFIVADHIAANGTDYAVFDLRKRSGGTVTSLSQHSTATTAVTAFSKTLFPNTKYIPVAKGDIISVNITQAGAGQDIKNGYFLIEYIEM
ncbi:hypothetical protein FE783_25945 [Paenibacillus mesophilus]|uniref:glycosyl hydrolase family 28-related protein n=1 Tax=Paenibacillus mesophilus TaxID=2582849 RepID=UPI00110F0FE7|nr:glycosyl hydrolase family 28-related protein [Paenibacillus mesophilus]TMV46413.1 hypothetical protein FE783_25945 [Paenibacillus mesophilus]